MDSLKKMNVFLKGMKLAGGAPRSVYQYMKILKQDGHSVTVAMSDGEKELRKLYENTFDRVILDKDFDVLWSKRNFLQLYRQLSSGYKLLKSNRPDLVFLLGFVNGFFYGKMCSKLQIPSVMIIAGGDLSGNKYILDECCCSHVICFSEENRAVLSEYIDDNRITVISNRIEIKKTFDCLEEHYDFSENSDVRILLTSRIDSGKYDSVVGFISLINSIADSSHRINLAIAGTGNNFEKLEEYVAGINNSHLQISLLGHVDNLLPEFEKAHIVVGKGRSVLEPIMMNRIGCVISDDGKLQICTCENFESLYKYNFAGRNPEPSDSKRVMTDLLDALRSGAYDFSKVVDTAELTKRYYSSEYLSGKFYSVVDNIKPLPKRVKHISIFIMVVKFVIRKLRRKVNKKR